MVLLNSITKAPPSMAMGMDVVLVGSVKRSSPNLSAARFWAREVSGWALFLHGKVAIVVAIT